MDRSVRIAIIVACLAITVAAIVVTVFVVVRTVQDRPVVGSTESEAAPADPIGAVGDSKKVQEACESGRLKLIKGEVTDPGERMSLRADLNKYCRD